MTRMQYAKKMMIKLLNRTRVLAEGEFKKSTTFGRMSIDKYLGVMRGKRYVFLLGDFASLKMIVGRGVVGPFITRRMDEYKHGIIFVNNGYVYGSVYDISTLPEGYYCRKQRDLRKGYKPKTLYYKLSHNPDKWELASRKDIVQEIWEGDMLAYRRENETTKLPLPGNPWYYGAPMIEAGERIRVRLGRSEQLPASSCMQPHSVWRENLSE